MERKNSTDMKNLCNTIREMAERPVETDMKKAFHGTLTEMARQVTDPEQLDEVKSRRKDRKHMRSILLRKQREAAKRLESSEPSGEEIARRQRAAKDKGLAESEQLDEVKKRNEWGMTQADAKKARKRTLARQAKAAKSYVPSEAAKKESDAVYRRVTGKPPVNEESTEEAMKRLAAKALKRARKKARGSSTDDKYAGSKPKAGKTDPDMKNARHAGAIAEMAGPGMEKWASDPKVKASFKKQYGKRWKQVMYAKSWKMSKDKGLAESDLQEGNKAKRMRIIRKAIASNNDLKPEVADFMKRSFQKQRYRDEILSGGKGAVKALEVRMKRRSDARKAKHGYSSSGYQGLPESEQLDELSKKTLASYIKKASDDLIGKKAIGAAAAQYRNTGAVSPRILDKISKGIENRNKGISRAADELVKEETEQLDEAGYKRLMRLKKAAYEAGQKGSPSHGRKMRAAAEREAQVAAGMARRGGASQEAVKGGGSRIGKSGKYTQKAGALANQRDKALAKFRARAGYNKAQGMSRSSTEKQISRNTQQFQDELRNKIRSGDFGQDNQAALRARSNFQKRYGRLKGK